MKTILITGSNRGIGLELVRCFAEDGWRVLACCRSPREAAELRELTDRQKTVSLYPLEVTDGTSIAALARELEAESIDILCNNAGIFGPSQQGFGATDPHGWLEAFHVNSIAPLLISEAFVEMVARSQLRLIASVGSVMGSIAENSSGNYYAYRSSKAAVHMVMKGLSVDLAGRGIRAVALHPGWVRTRMGGEQAPLTPAESAAGLKQVLLNLREEQNGCLVDVSGDTRAW